MRRLGFIGRMGAALAIPLAPIATKLAPAAAPAERLVIRVTGERVIDPASGIFARGGLPTSIETYDEVVGSVTARGAAAAFARAGIAGDRQMAYRLPFDLMRDTEGADLQFLNGTNVIQLPRWAERFTLWTEDGSGIVGSGSMWGVEIAPPVAGRWSWANVPDFIVMH